MILWQEILCGRELIISENLADRSVQQDADAWSASPIYLLGRYRIGVRNTGTGYDTFEVCPQLGGFQRFTGTVPLPNGEVSVSVDQEKVTVKASVPGGVLRLDGKEYLLEPEKEICVNRKNQ